MRLIDKLIKKYENPVEQIQNQTKPPKKHTRMSVGDMIMLMGLMHIISKTQKAKKKLVNSIMRRMKKEREIEKLYKNNRSNTISK